MFGKKTSALISTVALMSLVACQSTGVENPTTPTPEPLEPTPPPPAYNAPPLPTIDVTNPFNTDEFNKNYGLLSMNTHGAYAYGATGEGVTVAIIDDGIDLDHPDLADNISPDSIDILSGTYEGVDATDPHGTQLAGIIGALKNDIGIHGVAYNSTLLAIKAVGDLEYTTADVAAGIDHARVSGARVINLSITATSLPSNIQAALDRAVAADILIVLSAGNNLPTSSDRAHLDAISKYSSLASSNGQAIAVGAIDNENNLSFISNRPGEGGKDFYILAPGVDIISTTLGGGLHVLKPESDPKFFGLDLDASGTSFAAPHVAGAAALMFELFPNLTAKEVVELLLDGATDVGTEGVDAITGHGIINLGASIQPQGVASIPMGITSMALNVPISQSLFLPSPVFGDAFLQSAAFDGGFFQDRYRRAYAFDFRNLTPTPDTGLHLANQVDALMSTKSFDLQTGENSSVHVTFNDSIWQKNHGGMQRNMRVGYLTKRKVRVTSFLSQSNITPTTTLAVRHGFQHNSLSDFALDFKEQQPLNYGNTLQSFNDIAGFGTTVSAEQRVGNNSGVALSFSSKNTQNPYTAHLQKTSTMVVRYKGTLSNKVRFGIEVGNLDEANSLLNSQSFGAFGGLDKADTFFATLAASYAYGDVSLFGTYSTGTTKIPQNSLGLLTNFSMIKSNAFKTGLIFKSLFQSSGQLTLSFSQPLRVTSGSAVVDIATGLNRWDEITRETRLLSLVPMGQELDYSLAYRFVLKNLSMTANLLHRTNPGNISSSPSDTSFLVNVSLNF